MIFAGEASWRWRMRLPAEDRTHEIFWRQVARWVSTDAPDPVSLNEIGAAMAGDQLKLDTLVRDSDFAAVPDATVTVRVTLPGGASRELSAAPFDATKGLYRTLLRADQGGVYRVMSEARRGTAVVGTSSRWVLVGGADLEMADPRLNEDVLRRLAAASGGRYLTEAELPSLPAVLRASDTELPPPVQQDLWNNIWTLALVIGLLSTEWVLRRRWGMR